MIPADFEEMLKNDLDTEYEYKNHSWINVELKSGCIIAMCMAAGMPHEERFLKIRNAKIERERSRKMILANFKKMLENGFDTEYKYQGHEWINEELSCGCTAAVCLDVEVSQEDRIFVETNINKKLSLQTLIREILTTDEEDISPQTEKFMKELEETQKILSQFVVGKRTEYNFPAGTDCSIDYYSLKIKQGTKCNN